MSAVEILTAVGVLVLAVSTLFKNVSKIKTLCCTCEQSTDETQDDHKQLEHILSDAIHRLETARTITPRLRREQHNRPQPGVPHPVAFFSDDIV